MESPTWLGYSFAVLMVAVSLYCIGRLCFAAPLGRRNHYDVNVSHVLMGLAMAGMLVSGWNVVPNGLWEVVFAGLALYFAVQAARFVGQHGWSGTDDEHMHHVTHPLVHALMSCTMLYMYWLGMPISPATGGSTAMMAGPPVGVGDPGLTFLLIVLLLVSAVSELNGIGRFATLSLAVAGTSSGSEVTAMGTDDAAPWLAPRLEVWCHISMCVTMAYMLVLMV